MRDAERRFETLKMRIEERTYGARGEQLVTMDIAVRHPGHARVVTTEPSARRSRQPRALDLRRRGRPHLLGGPPAWARAGPSGTGVRGLDPRTTPARRPSTSRSRSLPMETLAELFVHPAGLLPERAGDGRLLDLGHGPDRRPRGRSSSSATTRGPSSDRSTGPTTTSRSPSIASTAFVTRLVESVATR